MLPWSTLEPPSWAQSESAACTHRDTFTVGVELKPRSVPLPVINAFLAGAGATLLPKNYALLNIVYIYYGSGRLVSYFTYNFVWFWFCTIYTTLDWDPRATDTRSSTRGSLGPQLGSLSLTVFSGGSLWSFVAKAKATKRCGISNNNWENTKIQKEISVWGLQRVFGWQT